MSRIAATWVLPTLLIAVPAAAIEEPDYVVVEQNADYEIRKYEPYLVAEVDVDGSYRDAGNKAFKILAGYIFGDNSGDERMNMTAPVESREVSRANDSGQKMKMTAPVLSRSADKDGGMHRYAFVMEKKYDLDSLPKPNNEDIRIREVKGKTVAVRRYSGRWTESNYQYNERILINRLQRDGISVVGRPYLARYNAPFMPWFLRRNEVVVEIADYRDSTATVGSAAATK